MPEYKIEDLDFSNFLSKLQGVISLSYDKLKGIREEILSLKYENQHLEEKIDNLIQDLEKSYEKLQGFKEYFNLKIPNIMDALIRHLINIEVITGYQNITEVPATKFNEAVSIMISTTEPIIESYIKD